MIVSIAILISICLCSVSAVVCMRAREIASQPSGVLAASTLNSGRSRSSYIQQEILSEKDMDSSCVGLINIP